MVGRCREAAVVVDVGMRFVVFLAAAARAQVDGVNRWPDSGCFTGFVFARRIFFADDLLPGFVGWFACQ